LGEGVFGSGLSMSDLSILPVLDGDVWFKHRKTSSHLFNLNIFKHGVLDTFNHHGEEMVTKIAQFEGKPFDIQDVFFRFTLDSIGQVVDIIASSKTHRSPLEPVFLLKNRKGTHPLGFRRSYFRVPFAEAFDHLQYAVNEVISLLALPLLES
jgi:hypothetical protein